MEIWETNEENVVNEIKEKDFKKNLLLSQEQKNLILSRWNDNTKTPPSIAELLKIAFPQESRLDKRSKEALLVKEFIVTAGIKINDNYNNSSKQLELTSEQKEYILNNCRTMRGIEMARILFDGVKIFPASKEVKIVNDFLRTLDSKDLIQEEIVDSDYSAPNTIDRCVARIKKCVPQAGDWDAKKLTPRQKKQIDSLMKYLHAFRFKHQIDTYATIKDKNLFETTFIKYCYDKDDLTEENIDQYILLCSEVVQLYHIELNVINLENEQQRVITDDGKMSMTLVEAIKTANTERSDCVKRQQLLYKSLTQERSDKLSEEIKDKQSLLSLINTWKNYESRQRILKLAGDKKDSLRKEMHELENLDEIKMRILGISIDEVVNG